MKLSAILEELGDYIIQTKIKDTNWKSYFRDLRFSSYQTAIAKDLYFSLYDIIMPTPSLINSTRPLHWHLFDKPNPMPYLLPSISKQLAESFEYSYTLHWAVLGLSDIEFSDGRMSLSYSNLLLSERIIKLDLRNGFGGSALHGMLHRFNQAAARNQIEMDLDLRECKSDTPDEAPRMQRGYSR
jgi:hypothetical protein